MTSGRTCYHGDSPSAVAEVASWLSVKSTNRSLERQMSHSKSRELCVQLDHLVISSCSPFTLGLSTKTSSRQKDAASPKSQQRKLADWALKWELNRLQSVWVVGECLFLQNGRKKPHRFSDSFQIFLFPEMELASNTYRLAGQLIENQGRERALTLDSLFPLQFPRPAPPFNTAPLYISPWQLRSTSVCEWGESHGFSAATGLRDSRHDRTVFVWGLNKEPCIERCHLFLNRGIWGWQWKSGKPFG